MLVGMKRLLIALFALLASDRMFFGDRHFVVAAGTSTISRRQMGL